MDMQAILSPEAIISCSKSTSKKRVLKDAAELASRLYGVDFDKTLEALLAREALGPTGMGNGIAIPHARIADLEAVHGVFMRLEHPLDFDASDRKLVDLVFVLLAPEESGAEHLKALARVSRVLRDEDTREKLRNAADVSTIYAILTENEQSRAA